MVKRQKKSITKKQVSKRFNANGSEPRRIKASTANRTCTDRLSPFVGILALIKFLDLMNFMLIFDHAYRAPSRKVYQASLNSY